MGKGRVMKPCCYRKGKCENRKVYVGNVMKVWILSKRNVKVWRYTVGKVRVYMGRGRGIKTENKRNSKRNVEGGNR